MNHRVRLLMRAQQVSGSMASCKRTRLARGLSHVVHPDPDDYQPRSSFQLLAALEKHVNSSGKEILEGLKDLFSLEKMKLKNDAEATVKAKEAQMKALEAMVTAKEAQMKALEAMVTAKEAQMKALEETVKAKEEMVTTKVEMVRLLEVEILKLQGINNTRGLFERMQEILATGLTNKKGTSLWEDVLRANGSLGQCVEHYTKVSAKNVQKQALHIYDIYIVLSQHVHAGKELAELQATCGKILFHRGPMSPDHVKIFLCLGKAATIDIEEDPRTRSC